MIISVLQPVSLLSVNGILNPSMQIHRQQKTIPTLSQEDKALFGNIEKSTQKMTQQDLMAIMGLVH